jgi:hypothetical protein
LSVDTVRLHYWAFEDFCRGRSRAPRGHSVFHEETWWHASACLANADDAAEFGERFKGERSRLGILIYLGFTGETVRLLGTTLGVDVMRRVLFSWALIFAAICSANDARAYIYGDECSYHPSCHRRAGAAGTSALRNCLRQGINQAECGRRASDARRSSYDRCRAEGRVQCAPGLACVSNTGSKPTLCCDPGEYGWNNSCRARDRSADRLWCILGGRTWTQNDVQPCRDRGTCNPGFYWCKFHASNDGTCCGAGAICEDGAKLKLTQPNSGLWGCFVRQ